VNNYSSASLSKPLTITDLQSMKQRGEKISCLTVYDASFSALLDKVGIDILLVGDSLGMVIQGQSTTVPVSIEDMAYHAACVARGRQRAFVIADMPFMSYAGKEQAADNAARLMQTGGVQMVKLEGPKIDLVEFLSENGVPVCGHLGLLPQSINRLGGYKIQGRERSAADQMIADACRLEKAGAALLVLECVPAILAEEITRQLTIPVIGIGAGADCDGQVLVLYDILDIGIAKRPRFSKNFMQDASSIEMAIKNFHEAVKQGAFPGEEHSFQ